jgi:hypothetical protein
VNERLGPSHPVVRFPAEAETEACHSPVIRPTCIVVVCGDRFLLSGITTDDIVLDRVGTALVACGGLLWYLFADREPYLEGSAL